jgi:protein-tyrosine phosphatase
VAAKRLNRQEAEHLVVTRPQGILDNVSPETLPERPASKLNPASGKPFWRRLFGTMKA